MDVGQVSFKDQRKASLFFYSLLPPPLSQLIHEPVLLHCEAGLSDLKNVPPQVKRVLVSQRENPIVNRLNKTKVEKKPDLKQERDDRLKELRRRDQAEMLQRVRPPPFHFLFLLSSSSSSPPCIAPSPHPYTHCPSTRPLRPTLQAPKLPCPASDVCLLPSRSHNLPSSAPAPCCLAPARAETIRLPTDQIAACRSRTPDADCFSPSPRHREKKRLGRHKSGRKRSGRRTTPTTSSSPRRTWLRRATRTARRTGRTTSCDGCAERGVPGTILVLFVGAFASSVTS